MTESSVFIKVNHENGDTLYRKGYFEKGNLVKFKYTAQRILDYDLNVAEVCWNYGIILDVLWYVKKPHFSIPDDNGSLMYDFRISNLSEGEMEYICIDTHDIFVKDLNKPESTDV